MDVGITELRTHLSEWLDRVSEGEEVIVTDRGTPVARIVAVGATSILDRLTEEGVIGRPGTPQRPRAGRTGRPRPKRPVSDLVEEQRR